MTGHRLCKNDTTARTKPLLDMGENASVEPRPKDVQIRKLQDTGRAHTADAFQDVKNVTKIPLSEVFYSALGPRQLTELRCAKFLKQSPATRITCNKAAVSKTNSRHNSRHYMITFYSITGQNARKKPRVNTIFSEFFNTYWHHVLRRCELS